MGTTEKLPSSVPPNKKKLELSKTLDSQLQKAKLGDSQAFSEIYDRYAGKIFNFASHMVGLREDAEDITQDTFFLAFRNLKSLREHTNFEQWLYRIARNEIYKKGRKSAIRPDSLDDADKGIQHVLRSSNPAANPENRLLSVELGERIKRVFKTLPIQYKETLVLATLQGLNYQEISGIQGRSISSVKTDIYRARLMILEKMRK